MARFSYAIIFFMARMTRRAALCRLAPIVGAGAAARLTGMDQALAPRPATVTAAATALGRPSRGLTPTTRPSGAAGGSNHRANGFHPTAMLRDFDTGKTRRLASGRVAARMGAGRARQGDRGGARHQVRGLDLQRAHSRAHPALPRGRAAADQVRQRLGASAHDPLPRHPPRGDGRRARASERGWSSARRQDGATSSTPSRSGCTSTTATHRRSPTTSPRACTARFVIDPKRGRAREADELVMVMNGFDTNFDRANEVYAVNSDPVRLHGRAGQASSAASWCASTWPTCSSSTSSTRSTCTPTSSTTSPPARRCEPVEFTDTVMQCQGQRGILEMRFPYAGQLHVPRPPVGVRRAGLDGVLRGGRLMEAGEATSAAGAREGERRRVPAWLLGLVAAAG